MMNNRHGCVKSSDKTQSMFTLTSEEKIARSAFLSNLFNYLSENWPEERSLNLETTLVFSEILHMKVNRCALLTSQEIRLNAWNGFRCLCELNSELRFSVIRKLFSVGITEWADKAVFKGILSTSVTNSHSDGERQGWFTTMDNINDACDVFYDACSSVDDAIKETVPEIKTTLNSFNILAQDGRQFLDEVKQKLVDNDEFTFISKLKQNWIPITANIYAISKAQSIMDIGLALLNIGSFLGVTEQITSKIMDWVSIREGGRESFDNTKKLATLAITMMTKFSPNTFVASFTGKINNTTKDIKAMDEMFDMIDDTLAEWGFDVSSKAKTVRRLQESLTNAIEKEAYFRSILATQPSNFCDSKIFKDFEDRFRDVKDINSELNRNSFKMLKDTSFIASCNLLLVQYKNMDKTIKEIRAASGCRVCPAAFVLTGKPGCGKTVWIGEMLSGLKKRFESEYSDKDQFACLDNIDTWTQWDQTATDEYHQGYNGQEVHVANELFADASDSDHGDVLRFVSADTFLTTQAALDDKGKPYQSRLFVGSANHIPKRSKTINKIEALHRRFKVVQVEMIPGKTYKTLDPDDLTLTDDDCAYDTDFSHLQFRILTVKEYHDIEAGKKVTSQSARVRTSDELLDYMIRDMRIRDAQFRSSSARQEEITDRTYNEQNMLYYTQNVSDLINVAYGIPNERGHLIFYRQLRRLKIDEEENLNLADLIARDKQYEDFQLSLPLIMELENRPSLPKGTTILMRDLNHNTWAWEEDTIFRTSFTGPWNSTLPTPAVDDEPIDLRYADEVAGVIGQKVYDFYYSQKWLRPLFGGARIVASYLYPLQFALPNTFANIAVTVLLYYLYCPADGALDNNPAFRFWAMTLDIATGTIALGILGFILYKLVTSWMRISPKVMCSECTTALDDGISALEELCDMSCTDNHTARCRARLAISKRFCSSCDENKCSGNCFHQIELSESDAELGYEELERLRSFQTEESPLLFKTKKSKFRLEESPLLFKTKKSKARLGSFEYKYGGHQPGEQDKPITIKARVGSQELMEDPNAVAIAQSIGENLTVRVERGMIDKAGNFITQSYLFGHGCGKQIITPSHLHCSENPSAKYRALRTINGEVEYIPLRLLNKLQRRDIAIWNFLDEKSLPFNTKLKAHLLTFDEMEIQVTKDRRALLFIPTTRMIQPVSIHYKQRDVFRERGQLIHYDRVFSVTGIDHTAPYTQKGDCGGLLIGYDATLRKKILGMHVAGTGTDALSTILTLDELIEMGLDVEGSREQQEDIQLLPEDEMMVIQQNVSKYALVDHLNLIQEDVKLQNGNRLYLAPGDFQYLGEGDMYRPSSKTTLKKHPLHGTFPVTTVPAITDENELTDATGLLENGYGYPDLLLTQVAKYGKEFEPLKQPELLNTFVDELADYFAFELCEEDLGKSPEYDILNGDMEDDASHPLDMRTSAGVPWMNIGRGGGKKKLNYCKKVSTSDHHGEREHYELDDSKPHTQLLRSAIDSSRNLAKKNLRTVSLMKDCLKDEPRQIEKATKPRAFKSFPLEKLYLFREYFLKFKTQWTRRREIFFHGVGVNVISTQWAKLHSYLASISTSGADADYSRFDGNLRKDFMEASNRIIVETITRVANMQGTPVSQEDTNVMEVLLDEIVNSISIAKSTIYMDTHGNPSGSPLTTVTNCVVNFLYHWYAYARITGNSSLSAFRKEVAILTFGDDVIQTFKPDGLYNFQSVQDIMVNELGQDYTTAAKETEGGTLKLSEMSFLKRRFVKRGGSDNIILSPIDPASIYQRFNWTHLKFVETEALINVLEESLLEAAQHGREFYLEFVLKLKDGIRCLKINKEYPFEAREYLSRRLRESLISFSEAESVLLKRYI